LPPQFLPRSETSMPGAGDTLAPGENHSLASVVERWRGRINKPRATTEAPLAEIKPPPLVPADAPPAAAALDPNRFKLLRRPLEQMPTAQSPLAPSAPAQAPAPMPPIRR
jgi:hypothetical protein